MRLTLTWQGPLSLATLPRTVEGIAALNMPAIYLRLREYDAGRTIAYVGRSRQLIVRIDQHLTRQLALTSALRDDSGATIYQAAFDERMAAFADFDRTLDVLRAEMLRLRFFYAPCEDDFGDEALALVEFVLKRHLETRLGTLSENRNEVALGGASFEDGLEIANRLDALSPEDALTLAGLLGEVPILFEMDGV